jgi:hypothetical protein
LEGAVRPRIAVALVTVGLAVAIGWPTAAFAATSGPPYNLAGVPFTGTGASVVQPCGSTILTGLGFQPNEPVILELGGTTLGTTTAESTGTISTTVSVPAGTAPGTYELIATGATGSSRTTLTVGTGGCHLVPSLTHSTIDPGESTTLSGAGCVPEAPVVLVIHRKVVGRTMANAQGRFSTSITTPGDQIGQFTVTASCGSRTFDVVLELVSTAKLSSPEASSAVFGVFVLLGVVLLRGLFGGSGTRRRRKRSGTPDNLGQT